MSNTSYWGGINLTDCLAALNEKHSAFTKDANGKVWMNITAWQNAEPDKFGNEMSIQLRSKEHANEPKKYIANLKKNKPKEVAVTNADVKEAQKQFTESLDDLPF